MTRNLSQRSSTQHQFRWCALKKRAQIFKGIAVENQDEEAEKRTDGFLKHYDIRCTAKIREALPPLQDPAYVSLSLYYANYLHIRDKFILCKFSRPQRFAILLYTLYCHS